MKMGAKTMPHPKCLSLQIELHHKEGAAQNYKITLVYNYFLIFIFSYFNGLFPSISKWGGGDYVLLT